MSLEVIKKKKTEESNTAEKFQGVTFAKLISFRKSHIRDSNDKLISF